MQDRPTALELLAAVRAFLEAEVVPALAGQRRFHARVAANVLGIVARELEGEEESLAEEWQRLAVLLGERGPAPAGTAALRAAVRALTTALVERIRAGEADAGPFAEAVRAHVRWSVVEKLEVASPRRQGG